MAKRKKQSKLPRKRAGNQRAEKETAPNLAPEREAREIASRARIAEAIEAYHAGGILLYGKILRRTLRHGPLRDLFDDLTNIPFACKPSPGIAYDPRAVREWVLLRFLDAFIDGGGAYPAKFYHDQYGIEMNTLHQAAVRGRLKRIRRGSLTLFAFVEVKRLWPHLVTFDPPGRDKP